LTISETIHTTLKANIIPINGGRCVKYLKIGTLRRLPIPNAKNNA
jgi:hypothetical protein